MVVARQPSTQFFFHENYGTIYFFEDMWRTEFANTHEKHGVIRFLEDNKHVRSEFAKTHIVRHDGVTTKLVSNQRPQSCASMRFAV